MYFASCICQITRPSDWNPTSHAEIVYQALDRAGYQYIHTKGIEWLCCSVAFDSIGYPS